MRNKKVYRNSSGRNWCSNFQSNRKKARIGTIQSFYNNNIPSGIRSFYSHILICQKPCESLCLLSPICCFPSGSQTFPIVQLYFHLFLYDMEFFLQRYLQPNNIAVFWIRRLTTKYNQYIDHRLVRLKSRFNALILTSKKPIVMVYSSIRGVLKNYYNVAHVSNACYICFFFNEVLLSHFPAQAQPRFDRAMWINFHVEARRFIFIMVRIAYW